MDTLEGKIIEVFADDDFLLETMESLLPRFLLRLAKDFADPDLEKKFKELEKCMT